MVSSFLRDLEIPVSGLPSSKLMKVWEGEPCIEKAHPDFGFLEDHSLADESLAHFELAATVGNKAVRVDFSGDDPWRDLVNGGSFGTTLAERHEGARKRLAGVGIVGPDPVVAVDEPSTIGSDRFEAASKQALTELDLGREVESLDLALGLGVNGPSVDRLDPKPQKPCLKLIRALGEYCPEAVAVV